MFNNRRLLGLLKQTRILFPVLVVFEIVNGILIIFQSLQLSHIITGVFLDGKTLEDVRYLLILFSAIVLGRVIFTLSNETIANCIAVKIKISLRSLLMGKINCLGPTYLQRQQSGELVTTAIQGVESLDAYFSQYLPQLIVAFILPVIILAVIFPIDWISGVIFLVTAPLIPFFMALVGKASEAQTKKQWLALSRLGADFLDTLQGLTTLKQLGQSKNQIRHVEEVSDQYRLATMNVLRITFLSALVLEMLATISTAVVAVEIGLRLLYGKMMFEQALFILLMAPEFYLPLRNLGMRYHAGMNGVTASVRIFQLLDEPEPERIALSRDSLANVDLQKPFVLKFDQVSFAYPGSRENSVKDLQIEIDSGRFYSLVGKSGAGKSTLLKLLMRFIAPAAGTLTVNRMDLHSIDLENWREQISWVPQAPKLFNTTLFENIRLEDESVGEDQVWSALDKAHLSDFVRSMPKGIYTPLGEWGAFLSSGQAQRVALARAFLRNAPLILMDEPSSHLDPELETLFAQSLKELISGKTALSITHRMSSLRNADRIIVMDRGQICGIGTDAELSAGNAVYADLLRGRINE